MYFIRKWLETAKYNMTSHLRAICDPGVQYCTLPHKIQKCIAPEDIHTSHILSIEGAVIAKNNSLPK